MNIRWISKASPPRGLRDFNSNRSNWLILSNQSLHFAFPRRTNTFSVAVFVVLEICFCHTRDTRLGFCSFPPIRTQAFDNLRESNQSACSGINAWQRSKEVSRPEKKPEIENHGYHCVMIFNSSFRQQNSKQQFLSGDFAHVNFLFNTNYLYKTKNLKSKRDFYLRDGRHALSWLQRTPAALVLLVCIPRTIQIRRYPCAFPRASDKIKKQTFTKQCASSVDDVGRANCSQLLIVQYQYKFANDLHFVKS